MIDFSTFRFLAPSWLLLLPPLWWLLWWLARNNLRKSMWDRICDPQLLAKMQFDVVGPVGIRRLTWPLYGVLTLAVLAAAGPSWRAQAQPIMESAGARVIALELSPAMRVQDVMPSRFVQAIAATRELIDADYEGETGLLVFTGAAFVVAPLSRDANTLSAFVDALEPGIMPLAGIRIDRAIDKAQDLLLASISGTGHIIVVTSGSERNVAAVQAAARAHARGHRVSIMAVGTAAGGPLIDKDGALLTDNQGRFVLARTNFADLQAIAEAGKGHIVSLTEATAYDELLGSRIQADNLVAVTREDQGDSRQAANDGVWLVWMLLPFALLLFRKNLIWVVLIACTLPLDNDLYAAETGSMWQHRERLAYAAYRRGDFERSAELSRNSGLKGAAYYKRGDYLRALDYFSRDGSAQAHYNRGNTLARLDRLQEAIAAYTLALTLDPGLSRARYNKRLLEIFLAEQQASDDNRSTDADSDGAEQESQDRAGGESRPGDAGQDYANPGDESQPEPGFGAGAQSGRIESLEGIEGREQQGSRFSPAAGIDRTQAEILINNWIRHLPSTSSELFQRKFLRDYQRQQKQSR